MSPAIPPTGNKTDEACERRGLRALSALNFFMADMQAGIGPFLGVFLLAHAWNSGLIGTVMTLGGIAGMLATAPAGALVDNTNRKRSYVIVSGVATLIASSVILLSQNFWVVAASQVASAIAGAGFVALTIVVAQGAMVLMSILAMRMAEKTGYWSVILVSFLALPIRGLLASQLLVPWGVYPVQLLDGVGAGLQSVAVPGLAARILNGTGRINVGQGALMTVQGIGAALSPAIGGWLAQYLGYPGTFAILGAFALVSLGLWIGCAGFLKPACENGAEESTADGQRAAVPA